VGLKGKWDQWFNVRINKQTEINKYKTLPNFLTSLGLECDSSVPSLPLFVSEIENGRSKLRSLLNGNSEKRTGKPITGVFVGGRKSWGKRWPVSNFCQVITALHRDSVNVVAFIGPEERDLSGDLCNALYPNIPVIAEPSLRKCAAMVSNCDLFVTGDSGPMHLAYALGTRTIAIFLYPNFDRWGPPAVRIAYQSGGCSSEEVLRICREELAHPVLALCG
jgi:ADP-heptose:LPS heptosyltransferase